MKTLLIILFFAGSTSVAADIPVGSNDSNQRSSMPGSKQAQLQTTKDNIMDRCMAANHTEAACRDMMKSCGKSKMQSCMDEKMKSMMK